VQNRNKSPVNIGFVAKTLSLERDPLSGKNQTF